MLDTLKEINEAFHNGHGPPTMPVPRPGLLVAAIAVHAKERTLLICTSIGVKEQFPFGSGRFDSWRNRKGISDVCVAPMQKSRSGGLKEPPRDR